MKLWDIKDSTLLHTEAADPSRRTAKPYRSHEAAEPISSISWHPFREYRLLMVTHSGLVELVSLHESIPLTWAPSGDSSFAYGRQLVQGSAVPTGATHQDISCLMKLRALNGYSMDIEANRQLMEAMGSRELRVCWAWMASIVGGAQARERARPDFSGILSLISPKPDGAATSPRGSAEGERAPFHVYSSAQRKQCLRICGWDPDSLESVMARLEEQSEFERAAAIAVFHLDIRRAILALKRAVAAEGQKDPNLKLVAMALAGYDGGQGLWKETCLGLKEQFSSAYLRVCFAFLCSDGAHYDQVLDRYDDDVGLCDRIAFACRFLPDADLLHYVTQTCHAVVQAGNLSGLVLTGLSPMSVSLLENYINRTADVQTASLVMAHVVPRIFKDVRVEYWLQSYRQLLDIWQLWHERALLDVARIGHATSKPPPQVYARCNFCNQSLSLGMLVPAKIARGGRSLGYGRPTNLAEKKQRIHSCPSCNKPLPLCCICLLPLGCTTPAFGAKQTNESSAFWSEGSSKFEEWFTWCQTCRHGGHAKHLMDWFADHVECPVTDCTCKCAALL